MPTQAAATQPAYAPLPGQTAPAHQGYGSPPYNGQPGGGPYAGQPGGGQFPQQGYAPEPARKSNGALIIGLAVGLAVLLLGGGAVGAYLYLNAPGPTTTVALPSEAPTTSPPSQSPESSDPPATTSPESSDPPTSTSPDPTSETPTPAATPSGSPTSTASASKQVQPGSPLTHSEFKDWNFALGGVKFRADKVGGWTYPSCTPVDGEGSVLTKNKCESAVQLAYSAYSGHIKAVQLLMSFPSEQSAKTAASRLAKLSSNAVRWRQDETLARYSYGKILSGSSKNYVVVTIVTADRSARSLAPNFHAYLQTDQASYFLLRDKTITS
ncbi:hypothetical protein ACIBI7_36485 [Nonomuraea fuscirosea]|uniref:hypothetical protein n=1 Tax=Nonomuraea fuscirosea TaxID=1291556 RepID=UPI0037AD1820